MTFKHNKTEYCACASCSIINAGLTELKYNRLDASKHFELIAHVKDAFFIDITKKRLRLVNELSKHGTTKERADDIKTKLYDIVNLQIERSITAIAKKCNMSNAWMKNGIMISKIRYNDKAIRREFEAA